MPNVFDLGPDWESYEYEKPYLPAGRRSSIRTAPTLFRWAGQPDDEGGPPGFDEPLASDRPDFTESSTTVGRRVLQIETGYTFTYDHNADGVTRAHSFPETLLRWGVLADWLELRFAYNHGVHDVPTAGGPFAALSGAEDIYLGAKLGLTSQQGWLPEMAIVPQATIPTGADDFSTNEVLPGLNWLYGWDINDWLNAGGSTQVNKAIDDDQSVYYEWALSWTFGYALTDRVGAYTEWFALLPSGANSAKPEYFFDGGFTFRVTNNLQLDLRGGVGLNDAASDYFLGNGAVLRF